MITLFGAAGYTGALIARALDRQRLPFRLAGRSPERLAALSAQLASRPACLIADARQPASLPALYADARLLINCAGPFTDLGEPLAALAAARGVHYLDITNELAYVYRLRQYDALARQTGAALVPACAFEVALADASLSALAADLPQPARLAEVVYFLKGAGMSHGTRLSGLRTFATSWLAFRGGRHIQQAPASQLRRGQIDGRPFAAISFPSAEIATLPAHLPLDEVRVWLAVSPRGAAWVTRLAPTLSAGLRTPLGWLAAQIWPRLSPPPAAEDRQRDRFVVQVELSAGADARRAIWRGPDMYGLTAEIIAWAANHMLTPGYAQSGVLAPAQALDGPAFLAWLKNQPGLTYETK